MILEGLENLSINFPTRVLVKGIQLDILLRTLQDV